MVFICTEKSQFKKQVTYNIQKKLWRFVPLQMTSFNPLNVNDILKYQLTLNFCYFCWFYNTSLALEGLSNEDIRTAVYSMSDFLRTCTRRTVFLHRRLLLDQHSCQSKHPLSFEGAEMFPTFLLTKSFFSNGLRRFCHN